MGDDSRMHLWQSEADFVDVEEFLWRVFKGMHHANEVEKSTVLINSISRYKIQKIRSSNRMGDNPRMHLWQSEADFVDVEEFSWRVLKGWAHVVDPLF